MPLAITKKVKSNKNKHKHKYVENNLDVVTVIGYLNDKACKQFKASSKSTARLVKGRFSEGYILADCKIVLGTMLAENCLIVDHDVYQDFFISQLHM